MARSQRVSPLPTNNALTWVFTSALIVTVLFVSFALFFSRSQATDFNNQQIPTQASVDNAAPVIEEANVRIVAPDPADLDFFPGKLPIIPTASTTAPAWIEIIVRDDNGWEDVDPDSLAPGSISYSGYFAEVNAAPCSPGFINGQDDYACYTPISFDNCSLVATSTLRVLVSCPFDLNYYTQPSENWQTVVNVTDRQGLSDDINNPEIVDPLLAYNIDLATLDFGAVEVPVSTVDNSNKPVRFANSGNVSVADLQVDHTPMSCLVGGVTPAGTIDVDSLAYSTSTIPDLSAFAVSGSLSGTDFAFAIPHAVTNTSDGYQSKILYNHLRYVTPGTSGSCSGTITFTPNS